MALDEALLESVAAGRRGPTVRFYQWRPAAVSLGVFQPFAEYERWAAGAGPDGPLEVVRRVTGGGAILHDREWTYSLVLPRSHPAAGGDPNGLYRAVHAGLIAGLVRLGVTARRRRETAEAPVCGSGVEATGPDVRRALHPAPEVPHLKPPAPSPRPDGCIDFLCFRRADPNDVVAADGRKIIGSAARRLPEAVLQHGSIVLWAPGDSGTGTSIAEQLGQDPDDAAVLSACRGGLAGALAVEWRPDEPTACEHARAAELVKAKHANADWLRRR